VIRTGFIDDEVFRGAAEFSLSEFLKLTFEVFHIQRSTDPKFKSKGPEDELPGRLHSTVKIDASRERFHGGGENRLGNLLQTAADQNQGFQFKHFGDPGTRLTTHQPAFHLGELPLALFGEKLKQVLADHQPQHGVSQKFQPFVGIESGFGGGAVSETAAQEHSIAEHVLNACFTTRQQVIDFIHRTHAEWFSEAVSDLRTQAGECQNLRTGLGHQQRVFELS
jgi:hypothetical protein